jgi:hypothetical protein
MSHTEGKINAGGGIMNPDSDNPTCWLWSEVSPGMQSGKVVAQKVSIADARRLVACWNAMEGLDDPEMWVMQMQYMDAHFGSLLDERDDLVKERDELVALLYDLLSVADCDPELAQYPAAKATRELLAEKYPEAS